MIDLRPSGGVGLRLPALATSLISIYARSLRIITFTPGDLRYPIYALAGTLL